MIIIAGTGLIRAGKLDEAVQRVQEMIHTTRQEEGCLDYSVYVDPLQNNKFMIFEQWNSQTDLERHFATPHFQQFGPYLNTVIDGELQIRRYEVSSVSDLF